MKAIIYSRVSTDAQERDGTSLDTQERACAEFAAERGWEVVRRIRDAGSGASLDREGLGELRAALRQGEATAVVAYAVDRLSRSQNHIGILFDLLVLADRPRQSRRRQLGDLAAVALAEGGDVVGQTVEVVGQLDGFGSRIQVRQIPFGQGAEIRLGVGGRRHGSSRCPYR